MQPETGTMIGRYTRRVKRTVEPGGRSWLAVFVAGALVAAAVPAFAQGGWWPWSGQQERGPPVPQEPVYRSPDQYGPPPLRPDVPLDQGGQPQQGGQWNSRNSICLQLEQRLVQEGQRGSESRNLVPMVENELRQVDEAVRNGQQQLDRMDCYDYFLFSKTLRRTRRCVDLANEVETNKRRQADLEVQRQQLEASSGRSFQDDIVRELARNNCGSSYEQQARRSSGGLNPFSSFWEDEESNGGAGYGNFGNLGYATYRTLCVRLCDGYYFPISFSTLPNHFQRDAEVCQSKCAAPSELYYHQNPGAGVDQAVAARTNELYTQLKTAFRYRKEYVAGCSCKTTEYVPEPDALGTPERQGAASPPAGAAPEQKRADAPSGELPWQPQPR
jgi:hypothetical protein